MWPFSRREVPRIELVVRHEVTINGLGELTHALRMSNVVKRFEVKARSQMIDVGRKDDAVPEEWAKWERENGARFEEPELLHLRWAYDVLLGRERVSDEKRREAIILYHGAQAAGYGLPTLDPFAKPHP